MSAKVYFFPHPFTQERREESAEAGVTIASLVKQARSDIPRGLMVRTFVNGKLISADKRPDTIVKDDDEIIVRIVPANGSSDRENAVATKVVSGAATALLGIAFLASGLLTGGMAWVAIGMIVAGIATSSVLAGLTESGVIGGPYADEMTTKTHPSLHGASNSTNPNGKVPLIFGKHLYTPGYLSPAYTELSGTDGVDQYLHMAFILGYGPLKVTDIKLGDTLVASNSAGVTNGVIDCDGVLPGCEAEIRQDTVAGTGLSLYPKEVIEQDFQTALSRWHVLESNKELSGVTLTVNAAARTITRSSGDWTDNDNDVQVGDYVAFFGFDNAGNKNRMLVTGISTTVIYCNQATTLVNESKTGIWANVWPSNIATTAEHTTQISVTITFTKLVKYSGDDKNNATVTVIPEYRLKVKPGETPNEWITLGTFDNGTNNITRNKAETLRFTATKTGLTPGQYEVQVRRQTEDPTDGNIQDTVYWTALRSYTDIDIMPANYRKKVCILGVKIKSSEAVANCISQLNCMVQADYSYIAAQDTAHDWASIITTDSSNTALAFVHAIMGPGNPRPRAAGKMDWDSIYAFAVWCNELKGLSPNQYRIETDGIVTSSLKLSELIQQILAQGRASLTMSSGKYGVVFDQVQSTPKQHIGPHNSWGFSGTKSYAETIHGYRIKFVNKDDQYVTDERIVLDDGYKYDTEQDGVLRDCWGTDRTSDSNYTEATKFESIEAAFDTNPAQVFGWGRYLLAVRRLRPELFTVNMDAENIAVVRGELVKVSHPAPLWGLGDGRLTDVTLDTNGNITAVTTDNLLTMEAGKNYAVRFRTSAGTSIYRTVATVAGETHTLTLSANIPAGDDIPDVGDWFGFGLAGLETVDCIVMGVDLNSDLSAKLTLFEAAPDVHVADAGVIPPFLSKVSFGPKASMPSTVTPVFPATADPIPYPSPKTLTALTDSVDFEGQYGVYNYLTYVGTLSTQVWTRIQTQRYPDVANATELNALTGMIAGDSVYQSDTRTWYKYTTAWVVDGQLTPTDVTTLTPCYLGRYNATHPASYNPDDWWTVYDTDDSPIQRGIWYSNAGTPTRISVVSGETGYTTDATLLAKIPSALADIAWAENSGLGTATNYGVAIFYESLAAVTAFVDELYVKHLTGADGTFSGSLVAATIQASSAIYSSDHHIAIYGDATSNTFGEGLVFTNNLGATTYGNFKFCENLYSDTNVAGIAWRLRYYNGTIWSSDIINDTILFSTSIGRSSRSIVVYGLNEISYTLLSLRNESTAAYSIATLEATYNATQVCRQEMFSRSESENYIKWVVNNLQHSASYRIQQGTLHNRTATATTTSYTNWFTPDAQEVGLIAYGNSGNADLWAYICYSGNVVLTRLVGSSTYVQNSSGTIQIKTNNTNNPMTFTNLILR